MKKNSSLKKAAKKLAAFVFLLRNTPNKKVLPETKILETLNKLKTFNSSLFHY